MLAIINIETVSFASNCEYNKGSFNYFKLMVQLVNFTCTYGVYQKLGLIGFKFQDFYLNDKVDLQNVNISNSQGIDWINSTIELSRSRLLRSFNVKDCGLTVADANAILIQLSTNADNGMGVGVATGQTKTISISGNNNQAYDISVPEVLIAKNNLISKGFTIN